MLSKNLFPVIALLAVTPVAFALPDAGGGGGGGGSYRVAPTAPAVKSDPTQAHKTFTLGFEEYQMATGLEQAGAGFTGDKAVQTREAVNGGFARARDKFRSAVAADPSMKEGWNMLGYTSRKLGDYEESMSAYDKALALDPTYPEAIEYRGELFLLMGRLGDAKDAYASLLKSSPTYAVALKTSMQDWLKSKKQVTGVSDTDRKEFATWVAKL